MSTTSPDVDTGYGTNPLRDRLAREVSARPERSIWAEAAVGLFAALAAVAFRYVLPLRPEQMPTLPLVVTLAIVTTFVGIWAGVTTVIVGGLLSWYFFFHPFTWSLDHGAWVPLVSFAVISTVIVTTSHLYRSSERLRHDTELARFQRQAENAELFAREMAHRLKNALTIVQSIAFQTIGTETVEAAKFAGRLRTLAEANELLNEHIETPTASVRDVVEAALSPFEGEKERFYLSVPEARIPAQQVVSLALAIHELATNATKYGALSSADGRVEISVQDRGNQLQLDWKEHDGPPVVPTTEQGFGTRLLRRSSMGTKIEFEPDGLRCTMALRKE